MKKNVLALSIAAMIGGLGFAGVASAAVIVGTGGAVPVAADIIAGQMAISAAAALKVSEGGVGNALVVPYFNVQNGNMSVFHVTNTDQANGKVVKVRFRSAANSDDILDFQLFLSPGDVWTAAVLADADGLAQLVTADGTCTVPALSKNVFQAFDKTRLPSFGAYADESVRNNLTREGYVEIFNMADITNIKTWDAAGAAVVGGTLNSPLYSAVKHVGGTAPCSVAGSPARTLLDTAGITTFDEATAAKSGLQTPTGGLMGDWYIMNVAATTTFSGAATAITADARANFTHFPQLGTPAAPAANTLTADPLFRSANVVDSTGTAVVTATLPLLNYDVPDLSTSMLLATPADPLAQATALTTQLAVTSISNQYANDASVSAKTDWVFSMPTRRYNVAANYASVTGASGATGPTSANPKYRLFTQYGGAVQTGNWFYAPAKAVDNVAGAAPYKSNGNTSVDAKGNICVLADGQKFFDREETTGSAAPVFSPGTASSLEFCGEVSVASFKDAGLSVLGADVARRNISGGSYTNGWAVIDTTNVNGGLPLLGASFIKLTNPQAGVGTVGTYGITWPHRYTK